MNMKSGTGILFTAEILHPHSKILNLAYLGNRDMKNFVLGRWCSAQNSAK